jgi:formyltetrahydrofolate deformylase
MAEKNYILTLSCKDRTGIVAAVSNFLADNDGFILESAQFGDPSTDMFFMRAAFRAGEKAADKDAISEKFTTIADKFKMDWNIYNVEYKPKVMILVSKASHCLNDILHRHSTGELPIEIPAIISNHEILKEMAEWHNIPFHHLPITPETKPQQEEALYKLVEELDIDVVVLARYMQILSNDLSEKLRGKAINIHHSFLPGFKGANPYKQAYDRGVKIIGATAHYVTADLDEGPIIEQQTIRVDHTDSPERLKQQGQDIESQVLSRALKYHIEHRVILNGSKTVIFR